MLDRLVPVRTLVLVALLLSIVAVMIGWGATLVAREESRSSWAQFSFVVAQFPEDVVDVVSELRYLLSPKAQEDLLSVPADVDPVAEGMRELAEGLYINVENGAQRGWRYVGGAFRVDGHAQSAVAVISPDFELAALWGVEESGLRKAVTNPEDYGADYRKVLHGLDVLPDGTYAVTMDNGNSLQRFDTCGKPIWVRPGRFHHNVTYTDGVLWALRDFGFAPVNDGGENSHWGQTGAVAVDPETGREVAAISFDQIRQANPDISLIDLPRVHADAPSENPMRMTGRYMHDPYHLNDAEPLPASLADRFPAFEAGDLLISSRTLNTVMIVDPASRIVKWYATGMTNRQHDPDWGSDGVISVFDNRMGRGTSEIIALDPAEPMSRAVLYDGAESGFYTFIRGKHELREDGTLAVISAQQGRLFEVSPEGRTVFELYSTDPDDPDRNFVITSMAFVPEDELNKEIFQCNDL